MRDFERFDGLVDIWIPNIYKHYLTHEGTREFYDGEIKAGREVNFYFKWSKLDRNYLHTRYVFWLMMKYGFGSSLYRATFWTRPLKKNRIEKWTWEVDKGFVTSRSSHAGAGYGIWFWPGKDELIPSVRAEMYRDGVEDYEYHYYLKELTKQLKGKNNGGTFQKLLDETESVLEVPEEIWKQVDSMMMPLSNDPGAIKRHRRKIAGQIVKVQEALK